jgi:hypothetical protein
MPTHTTPLRHPNPKKRVRDKGDEDEGKMNKDPTQTMLNFSG